MPIFALFYKKVPINCAKPYGEPNAHGTDKHTHSDLKCAYLLLCLPIHGGEYFKIEPTHRMSLSIHGKVYLKCY